MNVFRASTAEGFLSREQSVVVDPTFWSVEDPEQLCAYEGGEGRRRRNVNWKVLLLFLCSVRREIDGDEPATVR